MPTSLCHDLVKGKMYGYLTCQLSTCDVFTLLQKVEYENFLKKGCSVMFDLCIL